MSEYTHYSFNSQKAAEPIRLILAYGNVKYKDIRFERHGDEWPRVKKDFEWGLLPVLEVDGVKISQTKAIARFLARKCDLVGGSDVEAAKCDEYVDVLDDLKAEYTKHHFEQDPSKKLEIEKELCANAIPKYLRKFEEIIEKNGTGYLVGKKLTHADIRLANTVEQLGTYFPDYDMNQFAVLERHKEKAWGEPGIKEWIQNRP